MDTSMLTPRTKYLPRRRPGGVRQGARPPLTDHVAISEDKLKGKGRLRRIARAVPTLATALRHNSSLDLAAWRSITRSIFQVYGTAVGCAGDPGRFELLHIPVHPHRYTHSHNPNLQMTL